MHVVMSKLFTCIAFCASVLLLGRKASNLSTFCFKNSQNIICSNLKNWPVKNINSSSSLRFLVACFIDSAPRLGVYYFLLLTLSVCMSVMLLLQIASSFLFLDGIEPFWQSVHHVALYKTGLFDF